jgi:hypothetical protein
MTKFGKVHLFKTLVLSNGFGSLCAAMISSMTYARQGEPMSNIFALAAIYIALATFSGNMAAKGLPKNPVEKWFPVLIPLSVTALFWSVCVIFSGGDLTSGIFNVYLYSQLTHLPIVSTVVESGNVMMAFYLPFAFNAIFVASFAFFQKLPQKGAKQNDEPISDEPSDKAAPAFTLSHLFLIFALIVITPVAISLFMIK